MKNQSARAIAAAVLLLLSPMQVRGANESQGEPVERWVQANAAFEAGDYPRAAALYESLAREHLDNGRVSFNWGNALLRMGQVGRAIAAYRHALTRQPRDADIKANLAFARKSAKDAVVPFEPSPVAQTLFFWHYSSSTRELWVTALVANALLWLALCLRMFRRRDALVWVAALAAAVLLASGGSLLVRHRWPVQVAVVTVPETNVYSGTSTDSVVRFVLHEGTEAQWIDAEPDWVRIALSDGKQGWLKADSVTLVDAD